MACGLDPRNLDSCSLVHGGSDRSGHRLDCTKWGAILLLSPFVRQRLTFILNRERLADLERLRDLVERGAIAPRVDRTYQLAAAANAIRRLEAGEVQGKLAVVASGEAS